MRKRLTRPVPEINRLAVAYDDSAALLTVGLTSIRELVRLGKLEKVDVLGMPRITTRSIRRLVEKPNE